MEMKKEDFILVTALNGVKVLGLRPDYFDDKSVADQVKEVFEKKIEVEIVEIPGPTEEELAEIAHLKKEVKDVVLLLQHYLLQHERLIQAHHRQLNDS